MAEEISVRRQIAMRIGILFFLIFVLALLIYLYLLLNRPPEVGAPAPTPGITTLFSIYGYGSKPAELLNKPHGVTFDRQGRIYIADTGNHRVLVFNRRGRFLFKFGKQGRGKGEMLFPLNMAVAPDGRIYVTMMGLNKMHIYDSQGKFLKEIPIKNIIALTIVGNRLYMTTSDQVLIADLSGKILKKWGSLGKAVRQFEYPNGIGLDQKGNIFVSDTNNDRIQIFNKKGELIGLEGEPPTGLNDPDRLFGLGIGLTLDDDENIYVIDSFQHTIKVFDHNGKPLTQLGMMGKAKGQFSYPSTIAYRGGSDFAVADQGNNRIQVVRLTLPGKPKPVVERVRERWPFWLLLAILALIILILGIRQLRRYLTRRRAAREATS